MMVCRRNACVGKTALAAIRVEKLTAYMSTMIVCGSLTRQGIAFERGD